MARQLSKRQEKANDATRLAVEQATKDLRAENEQLRAATVVPPPAPIARTAPVAVTTAETAPDPADLTKYPAGAYDPTYLRDLSAYTARDEVRKSQTDAVQRGETEAIQAAETKRVLDYVDRVKATVASEPDYWSHITTEVSQMKPLGSLTRDAKGNLTEPSGPRNIIAEEVLSSPLAPMLMKALSKADASGTPNAELRRLEAGPAHLTTLPPSQRTGEHMRWIIRELAKLETQVGSVAATPPAPKTATSMPAPAVVLGSRAAAPADQLQAAVAAGDSRRYRELRRQGRLARLGK